MDGYQSVSLKTTHSCIAQFVAITKSGNIILKVLDFAVADKPISCHI